MDFEGRKRTDVRLNIAPLIDVIFLLLIFFMLSTHFVTQPGIKLTLPAAVSARLHPEEDIIVFIADDGKLYLNDERTGLDGLSGKIGLKLSRSRKKTVIIKADEGTGLGFAVKVMDIAKQAGAEGVVISTRTDKGAKR